MKDSEEPDLVSSGGSDEEVDPEDTSAGHKVSDRSTTPISCGATDNEDTDPMLSPGSNRPVTASPGDKHVNSSRTPIPPTSISSIATSLASSQHPLFSNFSTDRLKICKQWHMDVDKGDPGALAEGIQSVYQRTRLDFTRYDTTPKISRYKDPKLQAGPSSENKGTFQNY
ncbi:hypothetical protein WDU94_004031 [Cyamophila willieti]